MNIETVKNHKPLNIISIQLSPQKWTMFNPNFQIHKTSSKLFISINFQQAKILIASVISLFPIKWYV